MGSGSWTRDSFTSYSTVKGMSLAADGSIRGSHSNQEMFTARTIDPMLNPKNVIRECCDTEEHPNSLPVILALDITGSMGNAAVEVAKKLNVIMTKLYEKVTDVEFMIMGIGDLAYDNYPIQASQFESDIRIAEQLDKVYFEFGGGGNGYESYTAAWYFGSRHTKIDCLNRGRKGIIITMGDEQLNPYLPHYALMRETGDNIQADIETKDLYEEVSKKYNLYHLNVEHGYSWMKDDIETSFREYMDDKHFRTVNMDSIADAIVNIIVTESEINNSDGKDMSVNIGEISW